MVDKVVIQGGLPKTGVNISRQGNAHEQQDEPKTQDEFVGDFQVSKPLNHCLSAKYMIIPAFLSGAFSAGHDPFVQSLLVLSVENVLSVGEMV